tara:strand:- start:77875 stop:78081 length:207 start_codon:yes stop_codon:yes gene_type:complete
MKDMLKKIKDTFKKIKAWLLTVVKHDLCLPLTFTLLTMACLPISLFAGGVMCGCAICYFGYYISRLDK